MYLYLRLFFSFLICMITILPIQALSFELPATGIVCSEQLQSTLKNWKVKNLWAPVFSQDLTSKKVFRSPTNIFGKWAYIEVEAQSVLASLWVNGSAATFKWNLPVCTPVITVSDGQIYFDRKSQMELFALIKKMNTGIVYVWAPEMPASVYGYMEAIEAARSLGIQVVGILHPDSSISRAQEVVKDKGLPLGSAQKLKAAELTHLNLTMHAPSMAIFKDKTWVGKMLPGAEGRITYAMYIKSALEQN